MNKLRNLLSVFLILVSFTSYAGWRDKNGNPVADTEWLKSSNGFGVQLLVIEDEEEFLKRWGKPTKTVQANTTSTTYRGETISTPIIFIGCGIDKKGNCSVSTSFKLLKPDGSIYADINRAEVWDNKPAPPNRTLGLSTDFLKIKIEQDDPFGVYTLKAIVTDKNKKITLSLTQKFTVKIGKRELTQEQKDAARALREGDLDAAVKHLNKDLANKPKRKFEAPEEEAAAKAMSAGDYKTAVKYLKPLAEKGHVGAQNQLGMNYEYGLGVPKDYKQSARYYAMAAEQGHAVAQRSLALEYLKGRGTKKDLVEAYKWYTLAARTSKTSERFRQSTERRLTPAQVADGKARVKKWLAAHPGK